eukprot:2047190-Amphidinium_carterae.1
MLGSVMIIPSPEADLKASMLFLEKFGMRLEHMKLHKWATCVCGECKEDPHHIVQMKAHQTGQDAKLSCFDWVGLLGSRQADEAAHQGTAPAPEPESVD